MIQLVTMFCLISIAGRFVLALIDQCQLNRETRDRKPVVITDAPAYDPRNRPHQLFTFDDEDDANVTP